MTGRSLRLRRAGRMCCSLAAALVAGGVLGAIAAGPVSRRLAGRADVARRLFAVLVLRTAGYVAWRAGS